jgi:transposase
MRNTQEEARKKSELLKNKLQCNELGSETPLEEFSPDKLILPYGIGIDVHSRFIQVCVLIRTENKVLRSEYEFQCLWPELLKCREILDALLSKHIPDYEPIKMHYCIESTSVYHYPIVLALGGDAHIVNPTLAGNSRKKTDILDARMLAYQSMSSMWKLSFFPAPDLVSFRLLLGQRKRWSARRTQCSNRLNNLVLRFGHTMFAKASFGTYTRPLIEDLIAGKKPEVNTISDVPLTPEAKQICTELMSEYDRASDMVRLYTNTAIKYAKQLQFPTETGSIMGKDLWDLLESVPGMGNVGSLVWLSEIYDIRRFQNSKSLTAYCGCDPSLKVSAGKVTSNVKRGGNLHLYGMLVKSASSLIQHKREAFGMWGYRLYSINRKGGWKKACCAVARRLAVALYYVHKRCEPFSYEKYQFWKATEVPDVPIEQMNLGSFVQSKLTKLGLTTSKVIVEAYMHDLPMEKGVGEKCLKSIQQWIQQNKSVSGLQARSSAEKHRLSRVKIWKNQEPKTSTAS